MAEDKLRKITKVYFFNKDYKVISIGNKVRTCLYTSLIQSVFQNSLINVVANLFFECTSESSVSKTAQCFDTGILLCHIFLTLDCKLVEERVINKDQGTSSCSLKRQPLFPNNIVLLCKTDYEGHRSQISYL